MGKIILSPGCASLPRLFPTGTPQVPRGLQCSEAEDNPLPPGRFVFSLTDWLELLLLTQSSSLGPRYRAPGIGPTVRLAARTQAKACPGQGPRLGGPSKP